MKINYSSWYTMTTSIKKIFFVSAICLAGFMTVNAAGKTDSSDNEPILTTKGVANGEMSFNLKYHNATGDRLEVVLTDKEGNRLYEQTFRDKNLNKTFKVESDIKSLTLTVTNLNSKDEQKFEIFNHSRTVEKVIVTSSY